MRYKQISVGLIYFWLLLFLVSQPGTPVISESSLSSTQTAEQSAEKDSSTKPTEVGTPTEKIKNLFSILVKEDISSDTFWRIVSEIESLGKEDSTSIRQGLVDSNQNIRMSCARIVYQWGFRQDAVNTLFSVLLLTSSESDRKTFSVSAEVLGRLIANDGGGGELNLSELSKKVQSVLDETLDVHRRLGLAKLWFDIDRSSLSIKEVKEIANLKDPQIRLSAALILAEMDQFEKTKEVLKDLALNPTTTGRLAKAFLKHKEMQDAYSRARANLSKTTHPSPGIDYRILDEILLRIKENYVDPSAFDIEKLLAAAAKGIAGSLDKYSEYHNREEKKRAQENITGKYGGIGAYVNMRDNYLTIERPMYGQPAYKSGIRALDRITEIEGESTRGKNLEELVSKLKGDPGTDVKVKVFRRGWTKEKEFVITRAIINVKTARYQILPGNIGFLSIVNFAKDTDRESKEIVEEMKKRSVKSIIIDVRNNPGGLLNTVNHIVDLFLEKNKVIVTTKDRSGIIGQYKTQDDDKLDIPLYVLINEGSASASEILAGVLQDHQKATLIGSATFGKGSVQQPFDLTTTNNETTLKLTIAKYYLPSGRSVEKDKDGKGGVEPDIKITSPEQDLGKAGEFNKLLDSGLLDEYFNGYYPKNKLLLDSLAEDDGENYERYPDFEQVYPRSSARLDKDEFRQVLRDHLRRRVADERGAEFLVDFQTDIVLQRAIIEACRSPRVNINPETIPVYKKFAHKFDTEKTPEKESSVK
ncbi:MAG: S41 family peptidase [Planctomycetota bacterium]|nr:S41 family peptidase [Planctomycetota bacterium]MDI6786765.1 S41 family peptidase [Planctomycetota bacterium]